MGRTPEDSPEPGRMSWPSARRSSSSSCSVRPRASASMTSSNAISGQSTSSWSRLPELPIPKIEVLADGPAPLCSGDTLLGVVGMDSPGGLTVPRFDPADVEGLAEFLDRVLSVRRA